jgi:hypothetical protein
MSESLFSRAAVAEPRAAAESAEAPNARHADAPRGIALRRTAPHRVLAEPTPAATEDAGAALARLAGDRPTPAPRQRGWLSIFGGGR